MNTYCLLSRQNTPEMELREDGCLAREAHMARRIREAAAQYSRVLVVAGGFHIWGAAASGFFGRAAPPAAGICPVCLSHAVYHAGYRCSLSGYASGMPAPGIMVMYGRRCTAHVLSGPGRRRHWMTRCKPGAN